MTCCVILVILLLVSPQSFEHLVKGSDVFKTKHRFPCGNNQKGIRKGEAGPGQRERADLLRLRIGKEDPLFSPGPALREQWKAVAAEGMERVGNGKGVLSICATGCS